MKIFSDPQKDTKTAKPKPGSYEWWYFDAIDPVSELAVVVIFFDGNPFSTRYIERLENMSRLEGESHAREFHQPEQKERIDRLNHSSDRQHRKRPGYQTEDGNLDSLPTDLPLSSDHPAVSISVYHRGKHLFYSFEEVDFERAEFSESTPEGVVGKNRFWSAVKGGRRVYELELDQDLASGEHFAGRLTFTSNVPGDEVTGLQSSEDQSVNEQKSGTESLFEPKSENSDPANLSRHAWNLVMPSAKVSGSFSLRGKKSWHHNFSGTGYHDHNLGMEPMKDSFDEWYWGRFHVGNATFLFYLMKENGTWKNKAWWIDSKGNAEPVGGSITLRDPQMNVFGLSSARKITGEGTQASFLIQLEDVIDNGPYYQRFLARLVYEHDKRSCVGICEYIRPARIYSKVFWPLVEMRIRYPGRAHWVQKSPRLYRWTW